ncbi:MAG TPA: NUDIX domain-containing protein [Thermoplasmata archaeon]|nr:NUDIX domain-containing protein [Thermoplasmata archaeon]
MPAKADPCRVHRLVADVAVVADHRVLLVRYADATAYDGQNGWFLPDDFLRHAEHPDDAARRILKDQTALPSYGVDLRYIESFDGDGGPWHLVFHYVTRLDRVLPVTPTGNVAAAEWFPLDALPARDDLAHGGWGADVLAELRRRHDL